MPETFSETCKRSLEAAREKKAFRGTQARPAASHRKLHAKNAQTNRRKGPSRTEGEKEKTTCKAQALFPHALLRFATKLV